MKDPDSRLEFTPQAKKMRERKAEEFLQEIDEEVWRLRHVPGDDSVEATKTDVEEAAWRILHRAEAQATRRSAMTAQLQLIAALGIIMTLIGVFLDDIQTKVLEDPIGFFFTALGVLTVGASALGWWLVREHELSVLRERQIEGIEHRGGDEETDADEVRQL